jgi:hypothetical protein
MMETNIQSIVIMAHTCQIQQIPASFGAILSFSGADSSAELSIASKKFIGFRSLLQFGYCLTCF